MYNNDHQGSPQWTSSSMYCYALRFFNFFPPLRTHFSKVSIFPLLPSTLICDSPGYSTCCFQQVSESSQITIPAILGSLFFCWNWVLCQDKICFWHLQTSGIYKIFFFLMVKIIAWRPQRRYSGFKWSVGMSEISLTLQHDGHPDICELIFTGISITVQVWICTLTVLWR